MLNKKLFETKNGEPGNYGAGNLGLGILGPVKEPAVRQRKLNAGIANGRLAMMAIIGMFFQNDMEIGEATRPTLNP